MSIVVVTDDNQALADEVADEIQSLILNHREGFTYKSDPLAVSLAQAAALAQGEGEGPVLLLDHSDNVMSGGTCDTMDVLSGALSFGLTNIAVGPIADPQVVQQMIAAGVGATVTVDLGNKAGWTSLGKAHPPLNLTGKVKAITDGSFKVTGPIFTGAIAKMGPTAVLDTGTAQIVICLLYTSPSPRD